MDKNKHSLLSDLAPFIEIIRIVIGSNPAKIGIVIFALSTLNFSAYVKNFNGNFLTLVDIYSTTIYFSTIIITWTLTFYLIKIIFLLMQSSLGSLSDKKHLRGSKWLFARFSYDNSILIYALSIFIFLYVYIGSYVIFIFTGFTLFFLMISMYDSLELVVRKCVMKKTFARAIMHMPTCLGVCMIRKLKDIKYWKEISFARTATLVLVFTVSLGLCRAEYVKNSFRFIIIRDGAEEQVQSIFLTSSVGVFAWSEKDNQVTFLSWETGITIKPVDYCENLKKIENEERGLFQKIDSVLYCLL